MLAIINDDRRAGPGTWPFIYSRLVTTSFNSIRSLFLDGPAGRMESLLNEGADTARYAALVFHAMKALNGLGIPVLRFNFRGAGLSQGEHDHGHGEMEDVQAAFDWLDR